MSQEARVFFRTGAYAIKRSCGQIYIYAWMKKITDRPRHRNCRARRRHRSEMLPRLHSNQPFHEESGPGRPMQSGNRPSNSGSVRFGARHLSAAPAAPAENVEPSLMERPWFFLLLGGSSQVQYANLRGRRCRKAPSFGTGPHPSKRILRGEMINRAQARRTKPDTFTPCVIREQC